MTNGSRSRRIAIFFVLTATALAAVQFVLLRHVIPPPDGLMYFQVADQIQRVGYLKALPIHWSPLYPLYVVLLRHLLRSDGAAELTATSAGDAALLVLLCAIAVFAFRSLARVCWPDDDRPRAAWVSYAGGLALYCAFALLRVGLRMPDALVTSIVIGGLWAWGHAIARRLDLRWVFLAGLCGGIGYLSRANVLHWSAAAAIVACAIAPGAARGRRFAAFGVFVVGLLLFVGPETWVLSADRGQFTFGETGKIVFSESYGAYYPNGYPAWPERRAGGDVRVFTERHVLNLPGFYDPGREYDDAVVPIRWLGLPWAVIRGVNACLFGNWAPSFTLMWPMLWALWPIALFDIQWRPRASDGPALVRQRLAWFLMLAGSGGFAMHLLSFCNGYYMPPYMMALLAGTALLVIDAAPDAARVRYRACHLVSIGFATVAVLWTLHYFRQAERRGAVGALPDAQRVAARLGELAVGPDGLRRIAVAGVNWSGLYATRLASAQVRADVPDAAALHDPVRWAAVSRELRREGIVAVLMPITTDVRGANPWTWELVTPQWLLVDLARQPPARTP